MPGSPNSPRGLLRIATAGSVDDGKSTLIGRLLYDAKTVLADQMSELGRASRRRGLDAADLALLTDGLRAEREQGITIDVAYRYLSTGRRSFVLADTPGHVQYTRNMVTGASTADVAVLVVDARNGLSEQSRRHAAMAALLRVPHAVLVVNKMDLVSFDEDRFDAIVADFTAIADRLGLPSVHPVPVSALDGDNVVDPSARTPWYCGPPLLGHLEAVDPPHTDGTGLRFPVQLVTRAAGASPGYRGYAGCVSAGCLRPGSEVVVLPAGLRTVVTAVDTPDGELDRAPAGRSVSVRLADHVDVARGDLLADPDDPPIMADRIEATVAWFDPRPLRAGDRVRVRHTTRDVEATVAEVRSRLDVLSLGEQPARELCVNDLGTVSLELTEPLYVDPYSRSRRTGALVLVEGTSGATLGAATVQTAA